MSVVDLMELRALKRFSNSVGVIEEGERFFASDEYGKELIGIGIAQLESSQQQIAFGQGLRFVVMASGPSLTLEDIQTVWSWRNEGATDRRVVVVNTTFRRAPWADFLYAADLRWWDEYAQEAKSTFAGELWSQHEVARQKYGTRHIQIARRPGLSRIKGIIHNGGNSGYQAIGLATQLGASSIVLLGFDMYRTNGKSHHHGDHPKGLKQHSPYEAWLRNFPQLASDLVEAGVMVLNASRATRLNCFPRANLEDALWHQNASV